MMENKNHTEPVPQEQIQKVETKITQPVLPMETSREQALEVLKADNSIIIGDTGSGKTTVLPILLREAYPDARIIVSQPRVPAAQSVAKYVAKKKGVPLGKEVGYHTRFDDKTDNETALTFMTDGILLKMLQNDKTLSQYDIVMVDEAHERSLNIDFVLGLLKRTQEEREKQGMKQLKVVVTSATIEKEKFSQYFKGAPTLEVEGRMFPVEVFYEEQDVRDYPKAAANKTLEFIVSGKKGDILVFMPGQFEITKTIEEIEKALTKQFGHTEDFNIIPLLGSTTSEEQQRAINPSSKRKIVVATNVAETSLTIDGLGCVVDSGLINQVQFDPETGIEALVTVQHAKSGCDQRKGRAGRTVEGTCYRLYTESKFKESPSYQKPEILRSNLDHVILSMKKMGIDDVTHFDFMDKPEIGAIEEAISTLTTLGALNEKGELTKTGNIMSELPLSPEVSRMVLEADRYCCVESVCTIASMLGGKSVFNRPKDFEKEADDAHSFFKNSKSDFLTLLSVWEAWVDSGHNVSWARSNFLNHRRLQEAKDIQSQLFRELAKHGIVAEDTTEDEEAIGKSIVAGNLHRLMKLGEKSSYQKIKDLPKAEMTRNFGGPSNSVEDFYIHPSSSSFFSTPNFIIGSNVMKTKRTYTRTCQAVKPEWLLQCAAHLISPETSKMEYSFTLDQMVDTTTYSFKGAKGVRFTVQQEAEDKKRASKELATILAGSGGLYKDFTRFNRIIMEKVRGYYDRTGGLEKDPDYVSWYEKKLSGRVSLQDSDDEFLRMSVEDFIPEERKKEIERKYPTVILIQGEPVSVEYSYNEYLGSRNGGYTATFIFPDRVLNSIQEEDIPLLGEEDNHPFIKYKGYDGSSFRVYTTLSELKEERRRSQEATKNIISRRASYVYEDQSRYSDPYASIGATPPANTTLGDLLKAKLAKTTEDKEIKPEKKEEVTTTPSRTQEKELMTNELRAVFFESLKEAKFFIQSVKSFKVGNIIIAKDKLGKIEKLTKNADEIQRELNAFRKELETADNVERVRGKVLEFSKKGERLVGTLANLIGGDSWVERFRTLSSQFEKIAVEQEVTLTEEAKLQARDKIRILAESDKKNTDEELENILIEVA